MSLRLEIISVYCSSKSRLHKNAALFSLYGLLNGIDIFQPLLHSIDYQVRRKKTETSSQNSDNT